MLSRCLCGGKPIITEREDGAVEIWCKDCTRPHAVGKTKKEARKRWNQLCRTEREHWAKHKEVTGN